MDLLTLIALTLIGGTAAVFVLDDSDDNDDPQISGSDEGENDAGGGTSTGGNTDADTGTSGGQGGVGQAGGTLMFEGVTFGSDAGDVLDATDLFPNVVGAGGNDVITGTAGNNVLDGQDGNDTVRGGDGADQIFGSAGDDSLDGQSGDDLVAGGAGADIVAGGLGNDTLFGEEGDDLLTASDGNDQLVGGAGDDLLFGGAGNDTLFGSEGNDSIVDGPGDDLLIGGAGSDTLDGGDGDDQLFGIWDGNEDGVIAARDLDDPDVLLGGDGNDDIQLGTGDRAFGEAGFDLFTTGTWVDPNNAPVIVDLEPTEVVVVSVPVGTSTPGSLTIDVDGTTGDSIVRFNGDTVVIIDAAAGPVTMDQFLVVELLEVTQPTS